VGDQDPLPDFSEEHREAVVDYLTSAMDKRMVNGVLLPGLGIPCEHPTEFPDHEVSMGAALDKAVHIVIARNYSEYTHSTFKSTVYS